MCRKAAVRLPESLGVLVVVRQGACGDALQIFGCLLHEPLRHVA